MGLLWAAMDKGGRCCSKRLARVQRRSGRQVFVSTHSPDLLRDEGIGLDEAMLLVPGAEGTKVVPAESNQEVRKLLEGGLSLADVAIPRTRPENAAQLALFGDA